MIQRIKRGSRRLRRPLRTASMCAVAAALAPAAASVVIVGIDLDASPAAVVLIAVLALSAGLLFVAWSIIRAEPRRIISLFAAGFDPQREASATEQGEASTRRSADPLDLAVDAAARRARARLGRSRDSRRDLEVALQSLREPVIVIDDGGVIALANDAAGGFFEAAEPERMIGRPVEQTVTQAPLLNLLQAGRRGERRDKRVDLSTSKGPAIFEVAVRPVALSGGAGAVMSLRDVTELARTAQMKSEFVANASHELRTPLASMRSALETLRSAAQDDPASAPRFLEILQSHLDRLEELTRDLLDLSRLESPAHRLNIEPLRLDQLTSSLRSTFEPAAEKKRVSLVFDLASDLEGARTDPRLAHLALKNLIDNAIKFCDEGTTVRVVGAARGEDRGAGTMRFEVQDQGIGIPLDQQQRVFERFYQAQIGAGPAGRGTGLGLAIVKHAVGALGGTVGLDSVYKQGTTVWFEIPVNQSR